MDELNETGHQDVMISLVSTQLCSEEEEFRPESFSATSAEILPDVGDHGDTRPQIFAKLLIHSFKVLSDDVEDNLH